MDTHEWSVRCEGCTVQRGLCVEGFDNHKIFGIVYLSPNQSVPPKILGISRTHSCSLVFAACDAVCPVIAHLQVSDHITVRALVAIDLFARLDVEKGDFPRLVAGDNDVGRQCECAHGSLRSDGVEHIQRFF